MANRWPDYRALQTWATMHVIEAITQGQPLARAVDDVLRQTLQAEFGPEPKPEPTAARKRPSTKGARRA